MFLNENELAYRRFYKLALTDCELFLGSIFLFARSYNSLFSFTHKQIDLKRESHNLSKRICRTAHTAFPHSPQCERAVTAHEIFEQESSQIEYLYLSLQK